MCLSFTFYQVECSRISSTLDMIDFVGLPPILDNYIMGCHGNHAFPYSPYQFIFRTTMFCTLGVLINYLAPMKNCPSVEGRLN